MTSEMENRTEVPEEPSNEAALDLALQRTRNLYDNIDIISVLGGAALAIAFLALVGPIRSSSSFSILSNELAPVFIVLYVSLSTGHYLGLAVTGSGSNFVDGVFGMFLIFSIAVVYWSVTTGVPTLSIALLGVILGLVVAHHRGWVEENEWVELLVKVFGRGVVPLGVVSGILVEIVLPLIYSTEIDEFIGGLNNWELVGLSIFSFAVLYFILGIIREYNRGQEKLES